jgi:hypothetical protein
MGWDTERARASPIFGPLRIHGAPVFDAVWPGLDELQRLLDAREPPVRVASGQPLRIVRQGRKSLAFEERYEARTYLRGELEVRSDSLHDTFNALVWLAFPRAKAALNARHFAALREQQAARTPNRGPAQDALTLFDEGGVVVASCDDDLLGLLGEWKWKELFWTNRPRLLARMEFVLFGHALYEKALQPFIGITGRGILLKVERELLTAPAPERLAELDARLAAHLADDSRLRATRELAVVPILGVPGWCAENERESYYDNTDYFRPARRNPHPGPPP